MIPYPKIPSPFKRFTEGSLRGRLDTSTWTSPELEMISQEAGWRFAEKIDGMNIRVHWDGYRVTFGGRTDNAQIPAPLFSALTEMFPEELLEQTFGKEPATLYGEGCGPKIQKGGERYSDTPTFILFDVLIDKWWLLSKNVMDVACSLGVSSVPEVGPRWFDLFDMMDLVTEGLPSLYGGFAEGVVATAPLGLLDRNGNRIQCKIKHVDFYQGE